MKKESILFDNTIPSETIKSFINLGYTPHIWGGEGLFCKTKPAFKLAKNSGVNEHKIYWGRPHFVLKNNDISMFLTSDKKYKDLDGYVGYEKDDIKLSSKINLKRVLLERWVSVESKTGPCPICDTLNNLGWIEAGQPTTYTWDNGSKIILGLPPYRQAHSQIGEGSWKANDFSCKCYKDFKSDFIDDEVNIIDVSETVELKVVKFNHLCKH